MPNPSGIRPLPDTPSLVDDGDRFRRPDGTWDAAAMNAEWEAEKAAGKERRRLAKLAARSPAVTFIGPPNPYKPHRTR